jgi:outer membrane lipoprotein-sorting protein
MRKWLFLSILIPFFHLAACATLPTLPREIPQPEFLLHQVRARLQTIQGLKGLAHVTVSSPKKNFSVQQVLLARQPAFLRSESLSPLGIPQFYLATDGRELTFYHPGENRYYHGPATARHLTSTMDLPLEPQEIVALLLGGLPLIAYETASVRQDPQEGLWVLDLSCLSRGEEQSFWIHPESFHVLRVDFRRPGLSCRLALLNVHQIQGILFPRRIEFISKDPHAQLIVEYQEVELNPPWEAQDFHLPLPKGATIISLD